MFKKPSETTTQAQFESNFDSLEESMNQFANSTTTSSTTSCQFIKKNVIFCLYNIKLLFCEQKQTNKQYRNTNSNTHCQTLYFFLFFH